MGLEEKRKAKEIQDVLIPKFVLEIKNTVGADVTVDVAWDSFQTVKALESIESAVVQETMTSLKELGKDEFGKDALKGYLKKISIKSIPDYNNNNIYAKDGVLYFEEEFGGGSYVGDWKITEVLTKAL